MLDTSAVTSIKLSVESRGRVFGAYSRILKKSNVWLQIFDAFQDVSRLWGFKVRLASLRIFFLLGNVANSDASLMESGRFM